MKTFPAFISTIFLSITLFYSVSAGLNKPGSAIENFKWLLGTWETKGSRGSSYETWTQINPSEFLGKSYALKGNDTMVFETVRLVEKDGAVHYIPTVSDQNNGKPVVFKSSFISGSKFIVENPEHDFPRIISYTRVSQDQLVAEISGPSKEGKPKYQTFFMQRYPDHSTRNIELAKTVFRYFNEHNWEKMAGLYAGSTEFKDPSLGIGIVVRTRQDIVRKYTAMNKMVPDIKDEIVAIYPSGKSQVIVEFLSSGTSANGTKWSLPVVSIFTFENNLIIKDFTYYDNN